jgi:hypothetical protein
LFGLAVAASKGQQQRCGERQGIAGFHKNAGIWLLDAERLKSIHSNPETVRGQAVCAD